MADLNIAPVIHLEDTPHVSGDPGSLIFSVRQDTPTALATNGEYQALITNSTGHLYTTISGISDGTTEVGVVAETGALQTDLTSYGGIAVGLDNPIFVAFSSAPGTASANVNIASVGTEKARHNQIVVTSGLNILFEGKDFDGSALPNTVTEGDFVRPAASLSGVQYSTLVNENGSSTPLADHDAAIGTGVGVSTMIQGLEAKDFDGSALPNSVVEGDAVRTAASLNGVQYTMLTDEDGSDTPLIAESAVIAAATGGTVGLMQMVEARSSQKTAVTAGDGVRPVANLNGEQVIAGYNWNNNELRIKETDPLSEHYIDQAIDLDTTNITAATHPYPSASGLSLAGVTHFSISGKLIDADGTMTMTVWMMNDEDTTSGDWIQVYGYDDENTVTANSWTVTNGTLTYGISFNAVNFSRVKVQVIADGATNTAIIKGRTRY